MKYDQLFKKASIFYALASKNKQVSLQDILKHLSKLDTFQDQIDYAEKHLKHLSSGSSRIVYKTDRGTVIKLAKNSKGLAQNKAEVNLKFKSKHINNTLDFDKKYIWIESPFLKKITETQFEKLTSLNFKEFCEAIEFDLSDKKKKPKNYEKIIKTQIFKDVIEICEKHNLCYGDIVRISSWGSKDKVAVLADTGLTKSIYDKYYEKS